MHNVANIVSEQQRVLVVLSAVSGTTNSLVEIINELKSGTIIQADQIIDSLRVHYSQYINDLYSKQKTIQTAVEFITNQLVELSKYLENSFEPLIEFQILAKGEIISTQLFQLLLIERGKSSCLLNSLDFLRLEKDNLPDEQFLSTQLSAQLASQPECQIFIAQGFICRNSHGEISNLERGGSDYSASLFGAAINCEEIQIWTDIDGMHNNDPRYIENTLSIRELSFNEAAELAYFGAKILHPSSIKPARRKSIPVRLLYLSLTDV